MAPLGDNLQYAHLLEMGGTNSPQVSIVIQNRSTTGPSMVLITTATPPKQPTLKSKSTYEKPSVPLLTGIL